METRDNSQSNSIQTFKWLKLIQPAFFRLFEFSFFYFLLTFVYKGGVVFFDVYLESMSRQVTAGYAYPAV